MPAATPRTKISQRNQVHQPNHPVLKEPAELLDVLRRLTTMEAPALESSQETEGPQVRPRNRSQTKLKRDKEFHRQAGRVAPTQEDHSRR